MAIGCRGSSPLLGTNLQESPQHAGFLVAEALVDPCEGSVVYFGPSFDVGWGGLVARRAHMPKVVGSARVLPRPAAKPLFRGFLLAGRQICRSLEVG